MKRTYGATTAVVAAGVIVSGFAFSEVVAQETGTFTLNQGGNPIATESFTRTGDQLETQLEIPGQGTMATVASLNSDASVSRVELRVLPPGDPDAEPLQSLAAEFQDGTASVEQPIGTAAGSLDAETGTVPFLNPSPSYLEQILRRARAIGGSEVSVPVWSPGQGGGQVVPAQVTFDGETAALTLGSVTFDVTTDEAGRLMGAEIPAQGVVIERE